MENGQKPPVEDLQKMAQHISDFLDKKITNMPDTLVRMCGALYAGAATADQVRVMPYSGLQASTAYAMMRVNLDRIRSGQLPEEEIEDAAEQVARAAFTMEIEMIREGNVEQDNAPSIRDSLPTRNGHVTLH